MAEWTHKCGLTLVEILVVVAVIATLAGMVLVLTLRVENRSSEATVTNVFGLLRSALREYYDFTGSFPDPNDPALAGGDRIERMYAALDAVPASREVLRGIDSILVQRLDDPKVAKMYDPWGTRFDYLYKPGEDTFPRLVSAGPDKQFGTADDISSKGK